MQPSSLMTTPVTISRPGTSAGFDALGRPIPGTATTRTTVCRLVRKATDTPDPNVDGLLITMTTVFCPSGTGLRDDETLTVAGKAYEILGAPEVLSTPFGDGYERAQVRLIEDAS